MRRGLRSFVAAAVAVTVVSASGEPLARADEIDDQRARVEQIADDLEALENDLGQLDEEYGATLQRVEELEAEIATSQAAVDAKSAELSALTAQLATIAVDKYTSGGSSGLMPLFTTADAFGDELQRAELARVALDQGAGDSDEMAALVTDLAAATDGLADKKDEHTALLRTLEDQKADGEALATRYAEEYAAAEAELGNLIREEQERRAAAALAEAQRNELERQRAEAAASAPAHVAPRGSGAAPTRAPTTPAAPTPTAASPGTVAVPTATVPTPDAPAPIVTTPPAVVTDPTIPAVPEATSAPDVPAPSSTAGIAVSAAWSQIGVPYRFAAEAPGEAFDCSGLTKYAWGRAGVYLPHQSSQQYASTPHVPKEQAQPGDLIFYYAPIGHVGIYVGDGQLIHATSPGDVVKVAKVSWGKVVGVSRPG